MNTTVLPTISTPLYDFTTSGLKNTLGLKDHVDRAAREVLDTVGFDADIQVHIESECDRRGIFALSMTVHGFGKPIIVKKTGKKVLSLLKRVKKTAIKNLRRSLRKRVTQKRRTYHGRQFFSFELAS